MSDEVSIYIYSEEYTVKNSREFAIFIANQKVNHVILNIFYFVM